MRLILLNPPAIGRHLRSNYCSNISKGFYYYPAIDLLGQSGILSQDFEVSVLDAIADNLTPDDIINTIKSGNYEGCYTITGSSSRSSDLEFFKELKERVPNLKLLVTGGYLLTQFSDVLNKASGIDGILLDWASKESVEFFKGHAGPFSKIVLPDMSPSHVKDDESRMSYPTPRHELFPLKKYDHPNARKHPFSIALHSNGCTHACNYCIYSIMPYRERAVEDVITELTHLKSLGVKEVFFLDPTFAARRNPSLNLCHAMIAANLKISWFCQTRTDHMDEELLAAMRRAGCHAIMFGIESVREDLLKEHKRLVFHKKTEKIYSLCRKLGIKTLSYLIMGLPGDDENTIFRTVDFVKRIKSDFASFNMAIPVIGTGFRETALKEGLINEKLTEFDNSSESPFMPTHRLTIEELSRIYAKAVKSFYLRPGYLLGRLLAIRSMYELKNHFREGLALIRKFL